MDEQDNLENTPSHIYKIKKLSVIKVMIIAIVFFFLGLFKNFSPKDAIISNVKMGLASITNCPITYSKIEFLWFMPKVIIRSPKVMGKCFNQPGKAIVLNDIYFYFTGFGIFPPGPKFALNVENAASKLKLHIQASIFSQVLVIKNSVLDAGLINSFLSAGDLFRGQFELHSVLNIANQVPKEGKLFIKSTNLTILKTNINAFDIPSIPFKNFSLKATYGKNSTITISEIILGDDESPIKLDLSGKIKLMPKRLRSSNINLSGEISFTDTFLEQNAFLNILIGNASQKNGVYKISLSGTLGKMGMPKFQ